MKYLGFDLGASSGKVMVGSLDRGRMKTEILHRFPNRQILVAGGLYWDILNVFQNIKVGIERAAYGLKNEELSLGIDSFCNDYGLIDRNGRLMNQIYCYRDERTKRNAQKIYAKISKKELYMKTGSQTALFNTAIQMAAMILEGEGGFLNECKNALLIPDLLVYFLTGEINTEYTLASVTQLLDYQNRRWSRDIMSRLGIREDIFPKVISTGTLIGEVQKNRIPESENMKIYVHAVCGHDTASAVSALPTVKEHVAFISSGTWSIVGTEVEKPILTETTYQYNIAFEGGIDCRYRMLKNVMGLWLLQECQREYSLRTGKDCTYSWVEQEAQSAKELQFLIDPDDPTFYMPGNMIEKIIQFCQKSGQGKPESFGEIVRAIMESLAFKYHYVMKEIEGILGYYLEEIYILGGGGQNGMLNQFVANACGKAVYAGPYEAGLAGNLMIQMRSTGEISSLKEGRQIIHDSFQIMKYEPEISGCWQEKYNTFKKLVK